MAMKGSELTDTDSPYTLLHMIPTAKLQQLLYTSLSLCLCVFHMFLSQQEQEKEQEQVQVLGLCFRFDRIPFFVFSGLRRRDWVYNFRSLKLVFLAFSLQVQLILILPLSLSTVIYCFFSGISVYIYALYMFFSLCIISYFSGISLSVSHFPLLFLVYSSYSLISSSSSWSLLFLCFCHTPTNARKQRYLFSFCSASKLLFYQ